MAAVPAAPALSPSSRIRLHDLTGRPDGGEWIVGRMVTGAFVALPPVGERVVGLLGEGLSLAEVDRVLAAESGGRTDVEGFVRELVGLGFVREVDGTPVPEEAPPRPSLPRLTPRHVRWVLAPALPFLLLALVAAAGAVLVRRPDLRPGYRDLFWSPHGSLVLAAGLAVAWGLALLHEVGHLAAARAAGVPARIRLGTRLQFLVLQTDISGIEVAPRRHRLTAYLGGPAVNLTVASGAVLLLAATDRTAAWHPAVSLVLLLALVQLPFQLMVFMRTDLYFVLQDLTGCRDLYGDGAALARHLVRRGRRAVVRRGPVPVDPGLALPARERRAVRWYCAVQVVGTALCLGVLATVSLPADLVLLTRAVGRLGGGQPAAARVDGAVVLLTVGGAQVLWAVTRLRRRRPDQAVRPRVSR
jgi:hypothetical protein